MKSMNLKKKKEFKKIKTIIIILLFMFTVTFTFNYLNKKIYKQTTKEYLNFYTNVTFNTKGCLNIVLEKIFNLYDKITEPGDFRYE